MKPLVSVIIPIYNTEQYLNNCIESVAEQTVSNIEIILVDDGSTDSSGDICDVWKQRDSRIVVIHKQNEGLGYTRNAGLAVARGEYVSFLDSDDTLDKDAYEKCIALMQKEDADACYFGRKTMDAEGNISLNHNIPDKLVYRDEEVILEFSKTFLGMLPTEEKFPYIQASSCCVLYRRVLIADNDIRFLSERECLSEDTFFNLQFCKSAKCVVILPEDFYNYTYNARSLTKKYDDKKFEKIKGLYRKLEEAAEEFQDVADRDLRIKNKFIIYVRSSIKTEIAAKKVRGLLETRKIVKRICQDELVQKVFREYPLSTMPMNNRIFVRWVINKRCLLLMLYYSIRNE